MQFCISGPYKPNYKRDVWGGASRHGLANFSCIVSVLLHNTVCTVFCSAQTRLYTLPRKPLEIMIQASMFSELIPIFSSALQYNTYHYDSESSVMLNCFSTWLNNESSLCCTVCHDVWIPILDVGVKLSLVWHKHSLWRPAALPLSVLTTSFLRLDKLSLTYLCTRAVVQTRCSEGLCENDQGAMESAKGGDNTLERVIWMVSGEQKRQICS